MFVNSDYRKAGKYSSEVINRLAWHMSLLSGDQLRTKGDVD